MPPKLTQYPRLRFKHGAWYYDHGYNDEGKRVHEWLSRDKAEALIKWAGIEADGITPTDGSFASASKDYRAKGMADLSIGEQVNRGRYLDQADEIFGHMLIKRIQTHHIQNAYNLIPKKNTAQKFVTAMSAVFSHAISTGIGGARDNPCRYVKTKKIPPRDRCPSVDEFLAVHAIAPPEIQEVMIWAILTGWDMGQIISLLKDQISEEGIRYKRSKTIRHTKTRTEIREWNPHLRACYDRALALHPHRFSRHVFLDKKGEPFTPDRFKGLWRRTIAKAIKNNKLKEHYQFRDLRALAATLADAQGNNAQALLSHLTARQTLDYIRTKTPKKVQANTLPWETFEDS